MKQNNVTVLNIPIIYSTSKIITYIIIYKLITSKTITYKIITSKRLKKKFFF